jgi:hypothetical protein
MPYDDHGDVNNIIETYFDLAGETEIGAGKVKAKENALELLKEQKEKGEIETPKEKY